MTTPSVKWAAEIAHVREVSLLGTADLGFWKDRLAREELCPAERDGRARVLLIAADLRFMGVRFRELSFSVEVVPPGPGDAAFLVRAFNSCSFFAFCERMLFSTPYHYGDVQVSAAVPASIRLTEKAQVTFEVAMRIDPPGPARAPARAEVEGWDGPVFLPGGRRGNGRQG